VLVKDFTISETTGSGLSSAVSEVIVYANDKTTELARKTVTSDTLTFDNVNFVVEEGSENIYVKVVTTKQGKDEAGTQTADYKLAFAVTDAEGAASYKTVSSIDHDSVTGGTQTVTADSNKFSVNPVKVSAVSFVNSYNGTSVASTLTA